MKSIASILMRVDCKGNNKTRDVDGPARAGSDSAHQANGPCRA